MYKYYDLDGKRITKQDDFVKKYNEYYYNLNSSCLEQQIDELYHNKDVTTPDELITFLRWKVGEPIYKRNNQVIYTQYNKEISIADIIELAKEIDASWESMEPAVLLKRISKRKITNIGSTYSLALVSIITRGREPIYDRFAYIALDVIMAKNHGFKEKCNHEEIADKNNPEAVILRYEKYKDKLKEVFKNNEWRIDINGRDVDRALWTYGHLFA